MSKKIYSHELVTVGDEALAQLQAQMFSTKINPWVEAKKKAIELSTAYDAHIEEKNHIWEMVKELRSVDVSKGKLIAEIKKARRDHKTVVDAMSMNIDNVAKALEQAPAPDPEFDALLHTRGSNLFKKACRDTAEAYVREQPEYKKLEKKAGELQAEIIRIQGEIDALPNMQARAEEKAKELIALAHDQEKLANEVYAELTAVRKEVKQYE